MSRTTFRGTLSLPVLLWFLACGDGAVTTEEVYVPGAVYASFVYGTTESEAEALASDLGIRIGEIRFYPESSSQVDSAVFLVPEGEEQEWAARIEESPIVRYALQDFGLRVVGQSGCYTGA